jgi:GDP-4-dehydro-6-deoxy-D-mannose reductase
MTRVLITGCSGFLAGYLINDLKKKPDHLIYGLTEIENIKIPGCSVFQVDIRNQEQVRALVEDLKPDIVYHLAAISNVGFSWKNQRETYEVNIIGSSNLIEAVNLFFPNARIILLSSAELYGKSSRDKIDEKTPVVIGNPYALSKYAMEMVGDLYTDSRKMDIIKIRAFNFTGPGQNHDFVCSDFAYQIACIESGQVKPEIRVGNLAAVRDISDVRDVTRYLLAISERGKSGKVYNLCSGKARSIKEILRILLSFSKTRIDIIKDPVKFRPVDTPVLEGNCTLIRQEFGLSPRFDLEQTLFDILAYWRSELK